MRLLSARAVLSHIVLENKFQVPHEHRTIGCEPDWLRSGQHSAFSPRRPGFDSPYRRSDISLFPHFPYPFFCLSFFVVFALRKSYSRSRRRHTAGRAIAGYNNLATYLGRELVGLPVSSLEQCFADIGWYGGSRISCKTYAFLLRTSQKKHSRTCSLQVEQVDRKKFQGLVELCTTVGLADARGCCERGGKESAR